MWPGFVGQIFTPDQFRAYVAGLLIPPWAKFVTMHGTGSPTLEQWMNGPPEAQRIVNLQRNYEQLGWTHGPHLFCTPTDIIVFQDLRGRGTHASCWNLDSPGIETTGNWNTEDFNSGLGAQVRDNFVYAAAVLHNHLGLRPDGYVLGKSGLHLHRDCKKDGHFECPHADDGSPKFSKDDIVQRILAKMAALSGQPVPVLAAPRPITTLPLVAPIGSVAWVQARLNALGILTDGKPLNVDGDRGPLTVKATETFQSVHGLSASGAVDSATLAALEAA